MSQKFDFIDVPRTKIIGDLPRNKDFILSRLQQLHSYESKCKLGWLCDTLIQTYNTSVLDLSDPTFKNACIEQAHKCVSEENREPKREVLSQLILNHSNQDNPTVPKEDKKPIVDFIRGPLTLTMHWSKEYKKLIYIFGEYHSETTDCQNFISKREQHQVMFIEDYLEQLFKHTDAFIDFYLETYSKVDYNDGRNMKNTIPIITGRFQKCLYEHHQKKFINDCKLSRMHYFDIRKRNSHLTPNRMSYAAGIMYSIYKRLFKYEKKDQHIVLSDLLCKIDYDIDIKPILVEFSKINIYEDKAEDDEKYAEYYKFWDEQIEEHKFVVKKVVRSTIHDKIKSFIRKEVRDGNDYFEKIDIKQLIKKVKDFVDTLDKYRTPTKYSSSYYEYDLKQRLGSAKDYEKNRQEDFKILLDLKFSDLLLGINARISTDYYLLCRIFKVFDFTKKRRLTDEPEEPHNIIIYAGDAHSRVVRKFLEELDFNEVAKTSSKSYVKNCIDVRNFPQPFFSNHRKVKWSDELPEEFLVDNKVIDLEEEDRRQQRNIIQ